MRAAARSISLGELIDRLGGELRGSRDILIEQVAPLDSAGPEHLSFLGRDAFRGALQRSRAGAVVVPVGTEISGRTLILAANPYAYFVRAASLLNPDPEIVPGRHPMASIHAEAEVAESAEIGPFVSIERGAHVGERVRLGPGCRIGANVRIGDDSWLHANVTVYAHCIIGRRAVINAGAVIGGDGFGGVLDEGRWLKMPHVGRVVIGDDVDVGANTTIDRGAMADTVVSDGVKLDNQIQIGHNVVIGAHTTVAGCTGIAGSTRIGEYCVIGGAASIVGHLVIADRVSISAGSVIISSIDRPGRYTGIYPSAEHRAWRRSAVAVKRLGEGGDAARARHRQHTNEEDDHGSNADR
jgi:UDP-3-O-[3-hydroxymyristoyl] glucosamine N-acyltransferase